MASEHSVIRWGICSAGKISHDFCLALKLLPETEHQIGAVASKDVQRASDFADRFNIPKAYGSYDELAGDPGIRKLKHWYW